MPVEGKWKEPLLRLKKAIKSLRDAARSPVPTLLAAPVGDSSESRIRFVEECSAWLKRLSAAYGCKPSGAQSFTESSLLAIVFDPVCDSDPAYTKPNSTLALSDLVGEPPHELFWPGRSHFDTAAGMLPLARPELRECLDSFDTILNRSGLPAPPLQDGELRYITVNAEKSDTDGPEHWRRIYTYLRRRVNVASQYAESLADWADRARLRAMGRMPKEKRLAWVGRVKKLIERAVSEGTHLSLVEAAEVAGKDESTVWRQFAHYFKRDGSGYAAPIGILGEEGEVIDATRDRLPATRVRRNGGKK